MQFWRVMHMCILLMFCFVLSSCASLASASRPESTSTPPPENNLIRIIPKEYVVDPTGATILKDIDTTKNRVALVRVIDTNYLDDLDRDELSLKECVSGQTISVWVSGYYTKTIVCDGNTPRIYEVILEKIDTSTNTGYPWTSASNCAGCHNQNNEQYNEYFEWGKSNHAKGFGNHYFETMYLGTFFNGTGTSPLTNRDFFNDDLLQRAANGQNYHGPGYKVDYPNSNGNCAFCHAPVAVAKEQVEVNPFPSSGIIHEGITCDICHKVINVEISDNGTPYESRPGVLSFEYLLPPNSSNFYIGPLTSINQPESSMKTTCSTIFSKSEFCAACHYGKFYDTVIYGSYKEWKESPFAADPNSNTYRICQDCHMPTLNQSITDKTSAQRAACSAENTSFTNFDHNVMKFGPSENTPAIGNIPLMVEDAAVITPGFIYDPSERNWFTVRVEVMSKGVGHRFPTDSPLRHLILVVEAMDQRGVKLAHVNGERIPNWGGVGNLPLNPNIANYGGLPGKIFANLLVEEDTNISPTSSYWNKTKYAWTGILTEDPYDYSDTRLLPGRTDESRYSFAVPEDGDVTVTIKLIYRFAFIDLMWQKGWWDRPDILVTQSVCTGPATEPLRWTCVPPLPPP